MSVELPAGIEHPKEGWAYVGKGPFDWANLEEEDLALWLFTGKRWDYTGNEGSNYYDYAVRIGSDLQELRFPDLTYGGSK